MKKIFLRTLLILILVLVPSRLCFANESGTENYTQTKNSIDEYINNQLENMNIEEIQEKINETLVIENVDIKQFAKELIKGEKSILDLFNKDAIKTILFDELRATLKVAMVILVLALLSSILKSLDNSFASGEISNIINYIIFIVMVTFISIGFKEVLEISNNTIEATLGLMKTIMPILITLLALIGYPVTSAMLSPMFIGGATFIGTVFKQFLFLTISISFSILIVDNISKNIKLKKFAKFIKNMNLVVIGAIFTVYLGLVSIQGLYLSNIDNFTVKTAKYAVGNFIPLVGNFVSDSVDILLSSSQFIKGIFGGVGLVLLVGICIIPVIRIFSVIVVYKLAAMVVEPVGEDNMSNFLNDVSSLMVVLLACVVAISIMFFVTVGVLTSISVVAQG